MLNLTIKLQLKSVLATALDLLDTTALYSILLLYNSSALLYSLLVLDLISAQRIALEVVKLAAKIKQQRQFP